MGRTAVSVVVVASFCVLVAAGCQKDGCPNGGGRVLTTTVRADELRAGSVRKITVVTESGTLKISGGGNIIRGDGRICAPNVQTAKDIRLLSYIKDANAFVEARFPFTEDGARSSMNLRVSVPPDLPVSVVNRSAAVQVEKVAGLSIADLGGNLRIRDIHGSVTITNSSGGNVRITRISGTAAVQQDFGGSLFIDQVGGNVVLQRTETSNITVRNVKGDVVIWNDGKGNIAVDNVKGDLFVQADHGGTLTYSAVHGSVRLPRPGGF